MSSSATFDQKNDLLQRLSQAEVGCDFKIRALEGSSCDQLRRLGFCESLQVRKLANGRNLVCSVCGTRIALSSRLAEQVLVSPVDA